MKMIFRATIGLSHASRDSTDNRVSRSWTRHSLWTRGGSVISLSWSTNPCYSYDRLDRTSSRWNMPRNFPGISS